MIRQKKVSARAQSVQPYVEGVAKSLIDRLYGPEGPPWGTRLTELEDVFLAIQQTLSEAMLQQALDRQAQTSAERPEPYRCCPSCQGSVEPGPDPEPRNVQTRVGEAEWDEPNEYCRKCRRSFFPSEPKFGD